MIETHVLSTFHHFNFSVVVMPLIVVFDQPIDCPSQYVARLFDLDKGTQYAVVADGLDELRSKIPQQFVKLNRHESDDPVIVEVWA